jgi:hypothetical protein
MKKLCITMTLFLLSGLSITHAQGKFSGYIFGDYYYNIVRDASFGTGGTPPSNAAISGAAPGGTAMQAFQLRRIYFTYDNDISEQFTTRFRLEVDQAANASNGKIGAFVKDAYLKWKNIFSGSDLLFGIQPPPAYEVSEAVWGYRSLEKTIMDLRGVVASRDQGISLHGKLTNDGMINYWVMLANNSANSPETDKYKRYYTHIQVKPITNLQTTLYFDYKDQADIADAYNAGKKLNNAVSTFALFVGYSQPLQYSFGIEGFLSSSSNGLKDTIAKFYSTKTALGVSVFGSYTILPELAAIVRYDRYTPSTDEKGRDPMYVTASIASSNVNRDYMIFGVSYKVDKNVSIIPNIIYETYDPPKGASSPDASLTARLTFFYTFL